MATLSARNVETQKKKARRRIARPKQTRIQGNTAGVRTKMRKQALLKAGRSEA
ncbi:MAG: hypothetical protein RIC14_03305 [Filomicrobium sp.]